MLGLIVIIAAWVNPLFAQRREVGQRSVGGVNPCHALNQRHETKNINTAATNPDN
jgi:hypothetical protein